VVLSEPYPILGIFLFPLKRRRILLSIPNFRHRNTSGSSPAFCESTSVKIWLETGELEGSLLDDSLFKERRRFDHKNIDIILLIFQKLRKQLITFTKNKKQLKEINCIYKIIFSQQYLQSRLLLLYFFVCILKVSQCFA
jgi:hypothetical protein